MNENDKIGPLKSTSIGYNVVKIRADASIFAPYATYPKDQLRDVKAYTTPNSKSKDGVVEHLDLTDESGVISTAQRISTFKSAYTTMPRTFSVKGIPKVLQDLAPILEASSKVGKEMNAAKEFVYKEITNQCMNIFQQAEREIGRLFIGAATGLIKRENDHQMVSSMWDDGFDMPSLTDIWRKPHDAKGRLREHVIPLNLTDVKYKTVLKGSTAAVTESGEYNVRLCYYLASLAAKSPLMQNDPTTEALIFVPPGTLPSIAASKYLDRIARPEMFGMTTPKSAIVDKLSMKRYAKFSFNDVRQVQFYEYATNDLYPKVKNFTLGGSTPQDAIITPMIIKPAVHIWDGIQEQRLTALFPSMQELPIDNIINAMIAMAGNASTRWIKLDNHFYLRLDSKNPDNNGITMQIFGVLDAEFKHHTERGFGAIAWSASEFDNDSLLDALS